MTIVCGIDYSDDSRRAARCAAALAERLRRRLILLHAIPPSAPSAMHTWPYPASIEPAVPRETAERLLADISADTGTPADAGRVEDGQPAERLAAVASEEDAAMIVVGTHGDGAAGTVLLGSVSLATIRAADRPVVVVPPEVAGRCAAVQGDCVLCGVAGARDTRPARVAARLARALGVPLHLAHVAPPQDEEVPGKAVGAVQLAAPEQPNVRPTVEGRAALADAAEAAAGIAPLGRARLLAGDPAEQLDRLARSERAALLVVGTRARGALRAALLGSVSRSLACDGATPVVVCSERVSA